MATIGGSQPYFPMIVVATMWTLKKSQIATKLTRSHWNGEPREKRMDKMALITQKITQAAGSAKRS